MKKLSMSITEYYKRKIYHSGSEPVPATAVLSFYNGTTLLETQTITDGGDGSYSGSTPTKAQDAQYTYAFSGWSKDADDNTVDADALTNVVADRSVYACFTATLRKYTVSFVRASVDGGGTLQTINNVDYGTTITAATAYTGATPTTTQGDYPFDGWEPASATVHGDTTFTAKFENPVDVSEITDSWDTIIANIDNGTYATKYKIGQYKPLDLGTEGTVNMQIVAIDADDLADGSGKAPLTWVSKEELNTKRRMNPYVSGTTEGTGAIGGWNMSEMRTYLNDTIKPLIPKTVRDRINQVTKTSFIVTSSGTRVDSDITNDSVWIPSVREVYGDNDTYEQSGAMYTTLFNTDSSRIKYNLSGDARSWWLRSAYNKEKFATVSSVSGGLSNYQAGGTDFIALGFCLGLVTE